MHICFPPLAGQREGYMAYKNQLQPSVLKVLPQAGVTPDKNAS